MTEMMWDDKRRLWSEKPIARVETETPPVYYCDAVQNSIEVGDIIAYPIKRGSSACALRIARVTRDNPDKGHLQAEIRVRDYRASNVRFPEYKHKKVALKNPDRVVVIMRAVYATVNKFELPVGP